MAAGGAVLASPPLDAVGIDAEHAQLGAEAAALAAGERGVPGMLVVRVIGVEHHLDAAHVDGREVGIGVVNGRVQDGDQESDGALHVADDQIHRERRQLPPVAVRRLPGIARAMLQRAGPPGRANIDRAGDCWRGCLTVIDTS